MDIQSYIDSDLLALVPVLYLLGIGIKKSRIKDSLIPMALGIIAVLLVLLRSIASADIRGIKDCVIILYFAITQGVLLAGASVYINQIYLQSKKGGSK